MQKAVRRINGTNAPRRSILTWLGFRFAPSLLSQSSISLLVCLARASAWRRAARFSVESPVERSIALVRGSSEGWTTAMREDGRTEITSQAGHQSTAVLSNKSRRDSAGWVQWNYDTISVLVSSPMSKSNVYPQIPAR